MPGRPPAPRDGRHGADLVVAHAIGDHLVHLASSREGHSLCGHPTRIRPPRKSFREAGCHGCLQLALGGGHLAALEGDRSWINLRRLVAAPA